MCSDLELGMHPAYGVGQCRQGRGLFAAFGEAELSADLPRAADVAVFAASGRAVG